MATVKQPMKLQAARWPWQALGNGQLSGLLLQPALLTLALVYLTTWSVVFSVERARWVSQAPALPWIALGAVLTGAILSRVRFPGILLHVVGLGLGFVAVAWRTAALVEASGWAARIDLFEARLHAWVDAVRSGAISLDLIAFTFIISLAAWLVGYVTSWFVFRSRNPWPGVVLGGLAILTNLSYLAPRYYYHLALFLGFAMLLIAWVNFTKQRSTWTRESIPFSRFVHFSSLADASIFVALVLVVAWVMPVTHSRPPVLEGVWQKTQSPWADHADDLNRAFAGLPARRSFAQHPFGSALPFRGTINLGDEVIFRVNTTLPGYWRGRSYDVYTRQGWLSGDRETRALDKVPPESLVLPPGTVEVTHEVTVVVPGEVFFLPGMVLGADQPAVAEVAKPVSFRIDLRASGDTQDGLPTSLQPAVQQLREAQRQGTVTKERAERIVPDEFQVLRLLQQSGLPAFVEVARVQQPPAEVLALRPSKGQTTSYNVTTLLPTGTERELRFAGTDYPDWVRDRYLQLPPDFSPRVRALAQRLTARAANPYDKASAIEDYLRTLPYTWEVEPPPFNADGVEHFLFTLRKGYSDYFSSTMTVILRSVGIPARLALGYATGDQDPQAKDWVVKDKDSHAWPEVYFPGYGWVPFEPTPSHSHITRGIIPSPAQDPDMLELSSSGDSSAFEDDLFDLDFPLPAGPGFQQQSRWMWWWVATPSSVLFVLLCLAVMGRFWWRRGLGGHPFAAQAYEQMCRLAFLAGVGHHSSQTPTEFGESLSGQFPEHRKAISGLSETYARWRFGGVQPTLRQETDLREGWRGLFRAMRKRVIGLRMTTPRRLLRRER
ncbi:MAG: DUF4129 domain-containing protein [Chloroflexi bacterium]|nr:DUF4129 domain-containing protein [Chloroflexota bacterium]